MRALRSIRIMLQSTQRVPCILRLIKPINDCRTLTIYFRSECAWHSRINVTISLGRGGSRILKQRGHDFKIISRNAHHDRKARSLLRLVYCHLVYTNLVYYPFGLPSYAQKGQNTHFPYPELIPIPRLKP